MTIATKKLSELANIIYGASPAAIRVETSDIPIFGTSGFVGYASKPLLETEAVVVGRKGTLGNPIFTPSKFWAIDTTYAVIAKEKIDTKWLYYALLHHDLTKLNEATGVPSINRDRLYNIDITYFEYPEQRAIAQILSTLDEAIAQSESLVRKYQSIKQGLMSDLLTRGVNENGELRPSYEEEPELYRETSLGWLPKEWEVTEIEKKLYRVIDYRGKTPHKAPDGTPLITAKNVREGYLDPEPREYIYADEFDSWMNRGIPNEGDVMFTTEAPLGNAARVPGYKLAVGQRIITLQPKSNELDASYLFWLLLEPLSKQRIQQKSTGSTAVGIKSSIFVKIPFQFPKFPEQEKIGSMLNQSQMMIEEEEEQGEKLKLLKQGLMQDLLSGQVRVSGLL